MNEMDRDVAQAEETSESLIYKFFPDFYPKLFLADGKTFPKADYIELPLSDFEVISPKKYDIAGCTVWVPRQVADKIKQSTTFQLLGPSPDCRFLFLRAPGGKQRYLLKGANNRVLMLSASSMTFRATMGGDSSLVIGDRSFIGSARIIMVNTDISVGAGALWSDEIILQGSDQHGIIDVRSREILNSGKKSIRLERHVWLGRRCVINKNVTVGAGSIIGTGAIVTKDVPLASAAAGNPARVIKRGITWTNKVDGPDVRERRDLKFVSDQFNKQERAKNRRRWFGVKSIMGWMQRIWRELWLRSMAAGVAGAVIYEVISDLLPGT